MKFDEEQMTDKHDEMIRPRVAHDPGKPSKEEVAMHEATHVQYRSWCPHCVRGRGQSSPTYKSQKAQRRSKDYRQ
jgi:hypothetical protein